MVTSEKISRVFASLQGLERCYNSVCKIVHLKDSESTKNIINKKHKEILEEMRRVANKIQLFSAKKQHSNALRELKVFYGLNHMIRPDLMNAYALTTRKNKSSIKIKPLSIVSEQKTIH